MRNLIRFLPDSIIRVSDRYTRILAAQRRANVLAINDDEAIEAAYELTKFEGIIPALESAHALGALKKLKFKPEDVVVLTVSGRGDKDIETYLSFNEEKQDN